MIREKTGKFKLPAGASLSKNKIDLVCRGRVERRRTFMVSGLLTPSTRNALCTASTFFFRTLSGDRSTLQTVFGETPAFRAISSYVGMFCKEDMRLKRKYCVNVLDNASEFKNFGSSAKSVSMKYPEGINNGQAACGGFGVELFEPLMKEIFRRQQAAPEGEEAEPGIRFAGLRE